MKTIQLSTTYIFLGMLSVQPAFPQEAWQLTGKAWTALGNNNFDEVGFISLNMTTLAWKSFKQILKDC